MDSVDDDDVSEAHLTRHHSEFQVTSPRSAAARFKSRYTIHRSLSHASSVTSALPGLQIDQYEDPSADDDPLGLQLVCDHHDSAGDIIFVHGLGGTAWRTWCWNRDRKNFWPVWLADEDALSSFRIFSFGYNANFKGAGTNLTIHDFAKSLLLDMLTFSGEPRQSQERIGDAGRKIIFVVHSMGGLVVKRAYLMGKQDSQFASIVSRVHGVVFLATPHRGSQFAKMLNNILSKSPLGPPPKAYVADLDGESSTIQDINEQFRHVCADLHLVSFFETLKTSVGLGKVMVRRCENADDSVLTRLDCGKGFCRASASRRNVQRPQCRSPYRV